MIIIDVWNGEEELEDPKPENNNFSEEDVNPGPIRELVKQLIDIDGNIRPA